MAIRSDRIISILVVDDDATTRSVLEAILKKFRYRVSTMSRPMEALSILTLAKEDAFDLVLADVHMPGMDGIEFQKTIARAFNNLPVVLMSGDEGANIMQQGLDNGAKFFFKKPISFEDLENLWRHARGKELNSCFSPRFPQQNTSSVDSRPLPIEASSVHNKDPERYFPSREGLDGGVGESSKASSEEGLEGRIGESSKAPSREAFDGGAGKCSKAPSREAFDGGAGGRSKASSRQASDGGAGESSKAASSRKKKLTWTAALHCRFLMALLRIGIEKVTPKKILHEMNEPGLTKHHVASHLQKYRIFLREFAEEFMRITTQRVSTSSNNDVAPIRIPSSPPSSPRQNRSPAHVPGSSSAFIPGQEASSSSLIARSGLGNTRTSLVHDTSTSAGLLARNYPANSDPSVLNYRTHYVGPTISSVHHSLQPRNSSNAAVSFSINTEIQSTRVSTIPVHNESAVIDQLAGISTFSSSNLESEAHLGGGELWNVVNECQTSPHSNATEIGNVDNGGKMQRTPSSPVFYWHELLGEVVDGDGADPTSQYQNQNVGTSATAFGSLGITSDGGIHVPSSNQAPDEDVNYDNMGSDENGGAMQYWCELERVLNEDDVNPTSQDQNQNVGTSATTFGSVGRTSDGDIHVPSSNQAPDEEVNYDDMENVVNGSEMQCSPQSPDIDWHKLTIYLNGDHVNPTSQNQNQVQNVGTSNTTFGSLGNTSGWDIHVPSSNQGHNEDVNYDDMRNVENGGNMQCSPRSPVIGWHEPVGQLDDDLVNHTSQDQNRVQNVGTSATTFGSLGNTSGWDIHGPSLNQAHNEDVNYENMGNTENGDTMQSSPRSPDIDWHELDIYLDGKVGTNATTVGFLGDTSGLDIHVPSPNQAPLEDVNYDHMGNAENGGEMQSYPVSPVID